MTQCEKFYIDNLNSSKLLSADIGNCSVNKKEKLLLSATNKCLKLYSYLLMLAHLQETIEKNEIHQKTKIFLQKHIDTIPQYFKKIHLKQQIDSNELAAQIKAYIENINTIRKQRITTNYDLAHVNNFYNYVNCYYQSLLLIQSIILLAS